MLQDSDVVYTPLSRSPRGRGRGRGSGRGLVTTLGCKEHAQSVADEGQLQSDDDVVTINSIKLGKRSAPACCDYSLVHC